MSQSYKIIIPMAGLGSRMRPLTWSRPKPLLPLAGKTVLDYALDQFATLPGIENAEYVFITSPNQGDAIQLYMQQVHPKKKVHFVTQPEMLGQSHALWCAREHLVGASLIAFSDTLIETDLNFIPTEEMDAVAFVKAVEDPRRFGVIETDERGRATRLVEKPQDMSNNQVLVGFYYFKETTALLKAIEEQMQRGTSLKGEYFLADAINIFIEMGGRMRKENIQTWLDAGIPAAVLETNRYMLDHRRVALQSVSDLPGVGILPPVYIAEGAKIEACVIGPHVSIGRGCCLKNVVISNSIVDDNTVLENLVIEGSIFGRDVTCTGRVEHLTLGDNTRVMN
jgi:glucose-1-phosphate thymidylyltransferase